MFKNIYDEANDIVFNRKEERDRLNGPFEEGINRAAKIASGMTGKKLKSFDVYSVLVALKLSRLSYHREYDHVLDAIGYLGQLSKHERIKKRDQFALYDLDGVLIDSMPAHEEAYLDALDNHGIKLDADQFKKDLLVGFKHAILKQTDIDTDTMESIRIYKRKWIEENLDLIKPNNKLIDRLVDGPARTGILTNASRWFYDLVAKQFNFPGWGIEFIITSAGKPSVDIANEFMRKVNCLPAQVYYVGDSLVDHQFAEAAGWNYYHFKQVEDLI